MKPVYEMAVMNVRKLYPDALDTRKASGHARFRTSLRAALQDDFLHMAKPEEVQSLTELFEHCWNTMWKPHFVPDLWAIDRAENTIHIFEIEDTNPISDTKLAVFHDYWWIMDTQGWDLTLTVFDRYGLQPRRLELTDYAFHILAEESRLRLTNRSSQRLTGE